MAGLDLLCFDRLEALLLGMNSTDANKFDFVNYFEIWHKQCERFGSVSYIGEVVEMWIRKEDAAAWYE